MINKKIIIFLFAILLISNIYALGLTPARTTVNFEPGLEKTITFKVLNSDKLGLNLNVYATGNLSQYITIEQSKVSIPAGQESVEITYKVKLPDKLDYGLQTGEVVVAQVPEQSSSEESYVGATLAVATQLYVYVTYPGRYAEGSVEFFSQDDGVRIIIPVINRGEFDLVNLKANIDIYNNRSEKIASFNSKETSLKSRERTEIVEEYKLSTPGNYKAVITLLYDGETTKIEKDFVFGKSFLELQQIEAKNFNLGEIAKFEMLVENLAKEEVKNVYSQTRIFNEKNELLADFKSQTYDFAASSKKIVTSYWDTNGVREATYNAKVSLNYQDKFEERDLQFKVSQNNIQVFGLGYVIASSPQKGESNNLVIILVVVVVILVILNVTWFMLLRKRLKKS